VTTPPPPHPESVEYESVGSETRELPGPSFIESFLSEFLGALPEVRDSLVVAADALLDAARTLIDAADRVLHKGDDERESAP
jgi:hypothetical protein